MTIPGGFVAGTALPAADMNLLAAGLEGGGIASRTADQTTITSVVDLTGLTLTWTAVSGRSYLIVAKIEVTATVADGAFVLSLTDGAGTSTQRATDACLTTSGRSVSLFRVESGLSGSVTRKLRLAKAGGTGSLTMGAAATQPAFLLILDIGPT